MFIFRLLLQHIRLLFIFPAEIITMKYFSLIIALLLLALSSKAQIPESLARENNGKNSFVYKITSAQAKYLIEAKIKEQDTAMFSNFYRIVNSADDTFSAPDGHYLKVDALKNKLEYEYIANVPWNFFVLNNNQDLLIKLEDKATGKAVKSAVVSIEGKKLSFDSGMKVFRLKKANKQGIVTVNYNNETYYFEITKERNNSWIKRTTDNVFFSRPAKYITRPVIFAGRLPVDGVRSIINGHSTGTIRNLQYKFRRKGERQLSSKFFFSKPKYKPGDSVNVKSLLYNSKRKFTTQPLNVYVGDDDIFVGTIKPTLGGIGYNIGFRLVDSMKLSVDERHPVVLKNEKEETVASGYFELEDYELQRSILEIELANEMGSHIAGIPYPIKFSATDENQLPIHDARAEVVVTLVDIVHSPSDKLYLPDTLWHTLQPVPDGTLTIHIPDSIFGNNHIKYKVDAYLRTGDNEYKHNNAQVDFKKEDENLKIALEKDELHFYSIDAAKPNEKAFIYMEDRFDNLMFDTTVTLPFRIPVNTHAGYVHCETEDDYAELEMKEEKELINVQSARTADSAIFTFLNPRRLIINYQVYGDGKELYTGTGRDINIDIPLASPTTYYAVSYQYIWAGETKQDIAGNGVYKNNVELEVIQPPLIYPGQETTITVKATDYKKRPISGANIWSYGYTNKFTEDPNVQLPYLGKYSKGFYHYNKFRQEDEIDLDGTGQLNYAFWNSRMKLDTLQAYRFLYPSGPEVTQYSYSIKDSITQVAPFVIDNGEILPVFYVTIDKVPVYFGFTNIQLPYSFGLDTAKHQIEVRAKGYRVVFDSMAVPANLKTLFSIDVNNQYNNVIVHHTDDTLTSYEKTYCTKYLMGYKDNKNASGTYLETQLGIYDLSKDENIKRYSGGYSSLGPIFQYGNYINQQPDFTTAFVHEQDYAYMFEPKILKMEKLVFNNILPSIKHGTVPKLHEEILTFEDIEEARKQRIFERRASLNFQSKSDTSTFNDTYLTLELNKNYDKNVLNVLLIQQGSLNFVRAYSGNTRTIANLPPAKYQVILALRDGNYCKSEFVDVTTGGRNFQRLNIYDSIPPEQSKKIDALIANAYEQKIVAGKTAHLTNAVLASGLLGKVYMITGTVLDEKRQLVMAANIAVKGTDIATLSDEYGRFEIAMPYKIAEPILVVDVIGRYAKEFSVAELNNHNELILDSASFSNQIESVTVYGKSLGTYYSAVGSASSFAADQRVSQPITTIARAIEGKAYGISVSSGGGTDGGASITVLGNAKMNSAAALIIIDGAIYKGNIASLDVSVIENLQLLKDATSTSLYGSRGANGVILITTKKGAVLPENIKKGLATLVPEAAPGGLRTNFRDDAYWQPDLITDENGEVTFKAAFPDDITAWKTLTYAIDNKGRKTGQSSGIIKSYKSLSASLFMPSFLLQGDETNSLAKVSNLLGDSIALRSTLSLNNEEVVNRQITLTKHLNDTIRLTAPASDSLKVRYIVTKEDGYFDGEEKSIAIEPKGTPVANGSFVVLQEDGAHIEFSKANDKDTLYINATSSLKEIALDEIKILRGYKHLCTEQLASKVLANIQLQKILTLSGKSLDKKDHNTVQKMIDMLAKRQDSKGLWSWWENGTPSLWISVHVASASVQAQEAGYNIKTFDFEKLGDALRYSWIADSTYADVASLSLMQKINADADYKNYIKRLEKRKHSTLGQRLELVSLKQKLKMPYDKNELLKTMDEDVMGNIYWKDTMQYVSENEVLITAKALQIITADSSFTEINKDKIVNWLLSQRKPLGWRNTYESAVILDAIMPIVIKSSDTTKRTTLEFTGGINKRITEFPFQYSYTQAEPVTVNKHGNQPVYLTYFTRSFDTGSIRSSNNFELRSSIIQHNQVADKLAAGVTATMEVSVAVLKSSDFVMIEIPIPAGCSYEDKMQSRLNHEVHREYHQDKVCIFCEKLPKGTYKYSFHIMPRYTGKYAINPAKAELMYFPIFYGKEGLRKIEIE